VTLSDHSVHVLSFLNLIQKLIEQHKNSTFSELDSNERQTFQQLSFGVRNIIKEIFFAQDKKPKKQKGSWSKFMHWLSGKKQ
jgi:hypothetical protein